MPWDCRANLDPRKSVFVREPAIAGKAYGRATGEGVEAMKDWAVTGQIAPPRDILKSARQKYVEEVWDRSNGTFDALSFGHTDLGWITGTDHTFDKMSRSKGRCMAACLADAGINAVNPFGVPVNVFDDLNKPILEPSLNPLDWAPGVFGTGGHLLGNYADARFGHGHQWKQRPGRIPGGAGGLRMDRYDNMGKRVSGTGTGLRGLGGALNLAGYAKSVADCICKCKQ